MPAARELLGPRGPFAKMEGYELRSGQLDMASAVEHALDTDSVLLCEAGTGTGKTLAYLVPALGARMRVVVSTATKALQEQIVGKDLPLIERSLGIEARARLVKGLSNYLCLRRFAELEMSPDVARAQEVGRALPLVRSWAERTDTGDIAELADLPESHPIWREVTSSSDTRIGARCRHFHDCHVTRNKRAAEEAQLLIVNHHLFFADLALRGDHPGGALPPYDAVILDEAHKIEDVATSFFGARVSSMGVARLLHDTRRTLRSAGLADDALCERAQRLAEGLFALVNLRAGSASRSMLPAGMWQGPMLDAYHALDDTLEALEQHAATQADSEPVAHAGRRIAELRARLAAIVEPRGATVGWIERREHGIHMSASPVDVGPILRERLFAHGGAVVLTSASLTAAGSFAFLRSRVGLDEPIAAAVEELAVPPALSYRSQALLYTPSDLPEVNDERFGAAAVARIVELCALTPGGAFVLCTSARAMRALAAGLSAEGLAPLVQGRAPKRTLLERFRRDGHALLVATMSFWEGVDVPGEALSLVVIDRIPFAVPTDPIVVARCRALEDAGEPPFSRYSLPHAALLLKQGFGRLLRTRRDRGVVAILDRRILTRRYGSTLLDSLPEVPRTETLARVGEFFAAEALSSQPSAVGKMADG